MNKHNKYECDIFISWSYSTFTQLFAEKLKDFICEIYGINEKRVFVSSKDLSGEDWVRQIQRKANSCKLGISCMTNSTKKNEWLIYELGAMSYNTEVLLVAIDFPTYELTADYYSSHQRKSGVQENKQLDVEQFKVLVEKVFVDISNTKAISKITHKSNEQCLNDYITYSNNGKFDEKLEELFGYYDRFSKRYQFFISRPMRDYSGSENLTEILNDLFSEYEKDVYYSKNPKKVDGKDAYLLSKERVANIGNSGSFVLIWPKIGSEKTLISSCLIELGAALSLKKSVLVFVEKGEPEYEPSFFKDFKEFGQNERIEYENENELKDLLKNHIIGPLEVRKNDEIKEKTNNERKDNRG